MTSQFEAEINAIAKPGSLYRVSPSAPFDLTEAIDAQAAFRLLVLFTSQPDKLASLVQSHKDNRGLESGCHDVESYTLGLKTTILLACSVADKESKIARLPVFYKPSSFGFGRCYAGVNLEGANESSTFPFVEASAKPICAQGMARAARHTLYSRVATDVDIVNCHPVLMAQYGDFNQVCHSGVINNYAANRDSLYTRFESEARSALKRLYPDDPDYPFRVSGGGSLKEALKSKVFLKMFYGGAAPETHPVAGIKSIERDTPFFHSIIQGVKSDLKIIAEHIANRPDLHDYRESKAESLALKKAKKGYDNIHGVMSSMFFQSLERSIVQAARDYIETTLDDETVVVADCYDGLMLNKSIEEINDPDTMRELLRGCEAAALNATGYSVQFVEKPMKEGFVIDKSLCDKADEMFDKFSLDLDFPASWSAATASAKKLKESHAKYVEIGAAAAVAMAAAPCDSLLEYTLKAPTLAVQDLTALNNGNEMTFESDVEAGRFLGYHLIKTGVLYPVRASTDSPIDLYIHNPSVSNRLSSSQSVLLNLLEGLTIELGVGKKTKAPSHNQWKNIADVLRTYAENEDTSEDIYMRLNRSTVGKVFYRNGLYDLKSKRFVSREEDREAVTMVRVERDFWNSEEWDSLSFESPTVQAVWRNIVEPLGVDDSERNARLRIFARGIGGHFTDKSCRNTFDIGDRDSSKGTCQSMTKAAFGVYPSGYVTTGEAPVMSAFGVSDVALHNKQMISSGCHIARLQFTNELPAIQGKGSEPFLDGDALKAWEGGDAVTGRLLFGKDQRVVPIAFRSMAMNSVPAIKGSGNCTEYSALFDYPYKFVGAEMMAGAGKKLPCLRAADPTIKEKCASESWKLAWTWLVFNAWKDSPVEATGPEMSRRNLDIRSNKFQENGGEAVKIPGTITSEYAIFARCFHVPNVSELAASSSQKHDFFLPTYQISEIWNLAKTEENFIDNIDAHIANVQKMPPPPTAMMRKSVDMDVGKFLGRCGDAFKKGRERVRIGDKLVQVWGFHGFTFAKPEAKRDPESEDD